MGTTTIAFFLLFASLSLGTLKSARRERGSYRYDTSHARASNGIFYLCLDQTIAYPVLKRNCG
jgi:hypothetical protein